MTKKNYREALKIFKIIVNKDKNILCYIVGSGGIKDNIYVDLFIKFYRLQKRIIHVPYTSDVDKFYKKATVQLITSNFESFGLVIAEGKLYGIPLVIYDLPTVELLKDSKGCIQIEKHNIQEAANAILKIVNDKAYAEKLSKEARESIERFIQFDQKKAWQEILIDPCKQHNETEENNINNIFLFWNNVLSMYHEGLSSRPSTKQKFIFTIIQLKRLLKLMLEPFLPTGSKRRIIASKVYRSAKESLKAKFRDAINHRSLSGK